MTEIQDILVHFHCAADPAKDFFHIDDHLETQQTRDLQVENQSENDEEDEEPPKCDKKE